MKTAAEFALLRDYEVARAYLPNGVMLLTYRSPNGAWWSNWRFDERFSLTEILEFAAQGQPVGWTGWEVLDADPTRTMVLRVMGTLTASLGYERRGDSWLNTWLNTLREWPEPDGTFAVKSARERLTDGHGEQVLERVQVLVQPQP